jgi:uncharacterized protein YjcR
MNKELEFFVKNKKKATHRVMDWVELYSKGEIASKLEISRPTLNARLRKDNWKMKELKLILKNLPF